MNELHFLEQLQIIHNKLKKGDELLDNEYRLYTLIMFGLAVGIVEKALNLVVNIISENKGGIK